MFKKISALIMILCLIALTVTGCGQSGSKAVTNLPKLDMSAWQYQADEDYYYQIGIDYCESPADRSYEQIAIFVPGAYMDAAENGDGSYTCELNDSAGINGYTASTAPILMPVYTPGYAAAPAMTDDIMEGNASYAEVVAEYMSKGFVYAQAGCRGSSEGAPSGVTDLKAAVRYLRYCDDVIAGDADSIFVFGMSGGGAQAAILAASGDSKLYDPYLQAIGAVQGVSDAVKGSMDWCPIIDFTILNAEYEWMMGCTRTELTAEQQEISDLLAEAYADYVNQAGFTDENGKALTLEESEDGIYQAGTYYDYIKSVIERSLNNYLSDTNFPNGSAQDYIDSLNSDKTWISYDKSTNTATVSGVADFCMACKKAGTVFPAFDWPAGQGYLFSVESNESAHYDRILTDVLTRTGSEYAEEYAADLEKTDSFGNTVTQRVDMYSPIYFLLKSEDGYGSSTVAKYWRIRTGINQPTTSLTTEVNLALALEHCKGVESVDFETVWAKTHEEAERTGNSVDNFIAWVDACMKGE